jgi:uncharacterized RmlC-like cupin family protein
LKKIEKSSIMILSIFARCRYGNQLQETVEAFD